MFYFIVFCLFTINIIFDIIFVVNEFLPLIFYRMNSNEQRAGGEFFYMKLKKSELFNIPNILSYIRLLLIPLFVVAYIKADQNSDYFWVASILVLSGLTDFLDGFIARKYHMVTEIGKGLDPIADKLTQAAIVICLMFRIDGMAILFVIFAIKELFMGIACLVLLRKGKKMDGAKWYGKVSTFVFYVTMFLLIVIPPQYVLMQKALMLISGFFLILAFVLYLPVFWNLYQQTKKENN